MAFTDALEWVTMTMTWGGKQLSTRASVVIANFWKTLLKNFDALCGLYVIIYLYLRISTMLLWKFWKMRSFWNHSIRGLPREFAYAAVCTQSEFSSVEGRSEIECEILELGARSRSYLGALERWTYSAWPGTCPTSWPSSSSLSKYGGHAHALVSSSNDTSH